MLTHEHKSGPGVDPAPRGSPASPLRCLYFNTYHDSPWLLLKSATPPCAPQVFHRDHELLGSWEAMADQAEQCGTHLSTLRPQAAGSAAGD